MISVGEMREFGAGWFDAVARGATAAEQAQFFLDPNARIYVVWNGVTISLAEHEKLHAQWINERHSFGQFDLTPLNAAPERVRARGTVYWQAEFPGRTGTQCDQGRGRRGLDPRARGLGRVEVCSLHQHLSPSCFRIPRRSICDRTRPREAG